MNEVSNFCDGECEVSPMPHKEGSFNPNNPPYTINNRGSLQPLNTKTMSMDAVHYGGLLEYDVHNMYGITEANATTRALEAVRGKRAFGKLNDQNVCLLICMLWLTVLTDRRWFSSQF